MYPLLKRKECKSNLPQFLKVLVVISDVVKIAESSRWMGWQLDYKYWYSPSDFDVECLSLWCPVDGGHWPCDADTQEDVDSVGTGHVANRVVGILVLDGSHFTGESVCRRQKQQKSGFNDRRWLSLCEVKTFFRDLFLDFLYILPRILGAFIIHSLQL